MTSGDIESLLLGRKCLLRRELHTPDAIKVWQLLSSESAGQTLMTWCRGRRFKSRHVDLTSYVAKCDVLLASAARATGAVICLRN